MALLDSEPEALFYLFHVWFRYIKTNSSVLDDAMADTIELIEKAIGIAIREDGFGNDVLKDMILRATGRLASVSFAAGVCVSGGQFDVEVVEGCRNTTESMPNSQALPKAAPSTCRTRSTSRWLRAG